MVHFWRGNWDLEKKLPSRIVAHMWQTGHQKRTPSLTSDVEDSCIAEPHGQVLFVANRFLLWRNVISWSVLPKITGPSCKIDIALNYPAFVEHSPCAHISFMSEYHIGEVEVATILLLDVRLYVYTYTYMYTMHTHTYAYTYTYTYTMHTQCACTKTILSPDDSTHLNYPRSSSPRLLCVTRRAHPL